MSGSSTLLNEQVDYRAEFEYPVLKGDVASIRKLAELLSDEAKKAHDGTLPLFSDVRVLNERSKWHAANKPLVALARMVPRTKHQHDSVSQFRIDMCPICIPFVSIKPDTGPPDPLLRRLQELAAWMRAGMIGTFRQMICFSINNPLTFPPQP